MERELKACSECKQIMAISNFHFNAARIGKRESKCRHCRNAGNRKRYLLRKYLNAK